MSILSLRLANSLHKQLRELAKSEGVSINQLINSAVAEKISALMTWEYLDARARRGSRKKFQEVLDKVREVEPMESDRLPNKRLQRTRRARR